MGEHNRIPSALLAMMPGVRVILLLLDWGRDGRIFFFVNRRHQYTNSIAVFILPIHFGFGTEIVLLVVELDNSLTYFPRQNTLSDREVLLP